MIQLEERRGLFLPCFLLFFLPLRLAFPWESDVPLVVLISRLLGRQDFSSDKNPRQPYGRTISLPCHPVPRTPSWGVEGVTATGTAALGRHFAGLEHLCASLKLGPAIFLVTPCPAGGVGLSGKTCP